MPELLSINVDLPAAIDLAAKYGFAGVDTSAGNLIAASLDPSRIIDQFAASGTRPGYIGLPPGRIPAGDADWGSALGVLPEIARRAQELGFARAALVVLPFHETLPFDAAFAEHVRRINAVTDILDDFGVALALEYVAPISRRAAYQHHFVHNMRGMLSLCGALASPKVGLLLDSFHWHCAGESAADIAALPAERIVVVHINDAPDIPVVEQSVGDRALPGATGVINLQGFVPALLATGYTGPVTCEPMAKAVQKIEAAGGDVLAITSDALRKTLGAARSVGEEAGNSNSRTFAQMRETSDGATRPAAAVL